MSVRLLSAASNTAGNLSICSLTSDIQQEICDTNFRSNIFCRSFIYLYAGDLNCKD